VQAAAPAAAGAAQGLLVADATLSAMAKLRLARDDSQFMLLGTRSFGVAANYSA